MTHTKLLFTLFLSSVLVLLGLLAFGIYEIRERNEEISELENLISESDSYEVLAQSVKALRAANSENLDSLEKLVLSEDELVPLIEKIEQTGRSLGLETRTLSVEEVAEEGVRKIKIKVDATGDWRGAFSFLKAIESLPHRVIIDEVSLTKEETKWRASVSLALYAFE